MRVLDPAFSPLTAGLERREKHGDCFLDSVSDTAGFSRKEVTLPEGSTSTMPCLGTSSSAQGAEIIREAPLHSSEINLIIYNKTYFAKRLQVPSKYWWLASYQHPGTLLHHPLPSLAIAETQVGLVLCLSIHVPCKCDQVCMKLLRLN